LPQIAPRLKLVIIRHGNERYKPTSTTCLVTGSIPGTRLLDWHGRGVPLDLQLPEQDCFLLFPRKEGPSLPAQELATWPVAPTVVIVDGTWRQCRKMAHNVPGLRDLPTLRLPPGPAARPAMRTQVRADGLATAEAVARLLTAAGENGESLQAIYRVMVERVLRSRGTWERELAAIRAEEAAKVTNP
jgi:DTW domain-containing protein YfiP